METYHFIGLGGIGMSALARILLQKGHSVRGSDAAQSALLEELAQEGALAQVGHLAERVGAGMTIVYSSGIHGSNPELLQAQKLHLQVLHRADLLDRLMQGKKALLVTGTHGKTTTTALLTAVLQEAGVDPSFVVGGILRSLNTNGKAGLGSYFVAEADESDGSFLKTASFGAIVTNLEDEHLNYWGSSEKLTAAFAQFFAQVQRPQHLFWCGDDARLKALLPPGYSYGFSEGVDFQITDFREREGGIEFSLGAHRAIELNLFGMHNALNGAAVFGLALSLGIDGAVIRRAFKTFSGTGRRLEKKGEAHSLQVYDDYGHHPTEIRATLQALRGQIRERRLVVLFQPHRYSRVKDLMQEFLTCWDDADLIVLTDIYAAGEAPLPGTDLYPALKQKLGKKLHYLPRPQIEKGVLPLLAPHDVVLTIGAGDITKVGAPLLEQFRGKLKVGVLFGGTSIEHPISLLSARNIIESLQSDLYDVRLFGVTKKGTWVWGPDAMERLSDEGEQAPFDELLSCDVMFPVFHGPQGEDGMIQGFFDTLRIPYVGCDYRASSICMQKAWTKHAAILNNVPTAPYLEIDIHAYRKDPEGWRRQIESRFEYPVWVKAVHLGSSLGVTRAANGEEFPQAIENAFLHDDALIVEPEIDGREIEFSVLGNQWIRVAPPGEILKGGGFYDYDKKYGPNASGVQTPADISLLQRKIGAELAEKVFRSLGCKGLARVDFFLDRNGHFWLNEINPMPGFTRNSGYPKMWAAGGLPQRKLCDELIILGLHKSRSLR